MPHPPLIFPEVGRGKQNEIAATIGAYRSMGSEIAAEAPDCVVIVSPHSHMYADYIHISPGRGSEGDMKNFGVGGIKIEAAYDTEFVEALSLECAAEGLSAGTLGEK